MNFGLLWTVIQSYTVLVRFRQNNVHCHSEIFLDYCVILSFTVNFGFTMLH